MFCYDRAQREGSCAVKSDQTMDGKLADPSSNARDTSVYFVLVASLIVFGMGLLGSFHFDDYSLFSDPAVTSSSGWWQVWQPLRTRPLT